MPTLKPTTMDRLAITRLIFEHAREQARGAEPNNILAILGFHDAVENFLILAWEHVGGVGSSNIRFLDYWKELRKYGVDLSGHAGMDRLNRVRVDFKHLGRKPSSDDVALAASDTHTFFEDNTPRVFGIDVRSIDLTELVSQATAREHLREAEAHVAAGEVVAALGELDDAFRWLLRDYAERKKSWWDRGPFTFSDDRLRKLDTDLHYSGGDHDISASRGAQQLLRVVTNVVRGLTKEITDLQEVVALLATGIDYRRYARYSMIRPQVYHTGNGVRHVKGNDLIEYTQEHYEFSRSFVIYVSLHLAAEDFDLDLHEEWLKAQRTRREDSRPATPPG
ncbi:hypothetical protein AB0M47_32425 [Hamadaea sp. NPDC051192]|uniref:hypothetical protein n=1 Tax=Hamadaea sp. NPDC051192 TaxID=3154940 RepID=UPI003423D716